GGKAALKAGATATITTRVLAVKTVTAIAGTAKGVVSKTIEKMVAVTAKAKLQAAQKDKGKDKDAKAEAPEKEGQEGAAPDAPLPLLDLTDAAVKKMIKAAKKRGYVTHEQINAVLPSEEVTSDQIEDVFAMLNEMGINVVENEEPESEEGAER